ncbi:LOW QUALITY PROTEIN: tudor domain-containing protein 7A-like [Embiotoca jacksoni]|uniref:LOW QUALITY PROTEIN: tudor domain-containing protein 7A-like n=1 Tax=Embiotoca jacksoni TaxID=100190 RepID=UPI0037043E4D
MSDSESIKKMLRSVLQSSKTGVSISSLQSEYRSLCGETIPLKKLGFSKLEDYLRSIPSVVRLEYRTGELKCFAAVCQETAHIAELVARQRSSKKSGRSQFVNCKMRFKPSNPFMLNVRPRSSLRQPCAGSALPAARSQSRGGHRGFSASGDYRQFDQKFSSITPVERRQPAPQPAVKQNVLSSRREKSSANCNSSREVPPEQVSRRSASQLCLYDEVVTQNKISRLLQKFCSGLWMSKLPEVYGDTFGQKLHPQVLIDLEKWTHVCMVEQPSSTNRADRLIFPPLPPKPSAVPSSSSTESSRSSNINSSSNAAPSPSCPSAPEQLSTPRPTSPVSRPKVSPQSPLAKPTFIFPPQPAAALSSGFVTLRSPGHNPALAPRLSPCGDHAAYAKGDCKEADKLPSANISRHQTARPLAPTWNCLASNTSAGASSLQADCDILPLLKAKFSSLSKPAACPPSKPPAVVVSAEVRHRMKELLSKYSHGLWAHALPQLFIETYKIPFPEDLLGNLSNLLDICHVEYPLPHNKKKAILSRRADVEPTDDEEGQQCRNHPLPSGLEVLGSEVPPCLVLPSQQYSSVLVTEVKSSNAVTVRYVGENYSNAQETMEDAMHLLYNQSSRQRLLSNPTVGQLAAVRGEDRDELARAQVMEVMGPDKVKVYYMDHGFSVETSENNLLELHPDFLSLPFQATNVRLAGLEAFSSHPSVLSILDKLAVGKILLMETLEPCQQNEMPVAILYDTSQDDDVNVNSTCLKAAQDKTMNNPLTVNNAYQDACVTNVCADGIMYCQLPSRGTARLSKLLEETEAFFVSQMTSECLVSRPFPRKFCLARYKRKWARVEITSMYGSRVMDILFIDLGVPATVEVTDLREIPPLFLKDFAVIPPQAVKCRLADVTVPEGDWSPEALMWVKEAVGSSEDCKIKILKLDQHKGDKLVYMYLFIDVDSLELHNSINHQLAQSELWQKLTTQNSSSGVDAGLAPVVESLPLRGPISKPTIRTSTLSLQRAEEDTTTQTGMEPLPLPPPLELPQAGQNMDVFVPVACHPGYFVLQPWQDLHKLVVLMGEMILYYNQTGKTDATTRIEKGHVYAAKIDKNWYRVQVKGILTNGLVSVYELDHGKHELLRSTLIRPLIEEFRQLPFQAIAAQLPGMTQHQWSEEASMLFRNHVEKRALVAQVEGVQELPEVKGELWERRLTVYLVDTTLEEKDLWIHSIMADIGGELSSAL